MLLAYSGNVSWVEHVTLMVEERKESVLVVRKSEGKGHLELGGYY